MQKVSKRILLVGATGYAGRKLVSYLPMLTDATVVLAGRSSAKLEELQSRLRLQDPANRVELLEPDADDFDFAVPADIELLVNATAAGPHNAALIQACLEQEWTGLTCK